LIEGWSLKRRRRLVEGEEASSNEGSEGSECGMNGGEEDDEENEAEFVSLRRLME